MGTRTALDDWMQGSGAKHPLHEDMRLRGAEDYLDALDRLLREVTAASPLRILSKRRDFRALTEKERWWDLLSELLMARWLTSSNVAYEFGAAGEPQPDFVLPDHGLGLEVTRRARRARYDLQMTVMRAARAAEPSFRRRARPRITLDGQPLSVRLGTLQQIAAAVETAVHQGDDTVHAVLRPSRDGKPPITAVIELHKGFSVLPHVKYLPQAAELTVTMLDIEDVIVDCLSDRRKAQQGAAMPTLLLIDTTRLSDVVWLRSPTAWAKRLPALMQEHHTFVGVGMFAMSLYDDQPHLALGIAPWANDDARTSVADLAVALGIGSTAREDG